ncbi:hypothetical protein TWF694_004729 [Orbilia ellipsospora]|uniref:Uncharacterized protein n=1 Tax=Orbilia ellipsospora TaxID=2528407 RepID=A0AAV9WW40_9PEZI
MPPLKRDHHIGFSNVSLRVGGMKTDKGRFKYHLTTNKVRYQWHNTDSSGRNVPFDAESHLRMSYKMKNGNTVIGKPTFVQHFFRKKGQPERDETPGSEPKNWEVQKGDATEFETRYGFNLEIRAGDLKLFPGGRCTLAIDIECPWGEEAWLLGRKIDHFYDIGGVDNKVYHRIEYFNTSGFAPYFVAPDFTYGLEQYSDTKPLFEFVVNYSNNIYVLLRSKMDGFRAAQ